MDVASEALDLDRLIERRASKTPDPDEREESWKASVRAYHARLQQEHLWERLRFHERQIQNHTTTFREIVRRHKAALAECERALGISVEEAGRG